MSIQTKNKKPFEREAFPINLNIRINKQMDDDLNYVANFIPKGKFTRIAIGKLLPVYMEKFKAMEHEPYK